MEVKVKMLFYGNSIIWVNPLECKITRPFIKLAFILSFDKYHKVENEYVHFYLLLFFQITKEYFYVIKTFQF